MSNQTANPNASRRPHKPYDPTDPPRLVLRDDGTSNFAKWKEEMLAFSQKHFGAWGSIIETETLPTVDLPELDGESIIDIKAEVDELVYSRQQMRTRLEVLLATPIATSTPAATSTPIDTTAEPAAGTKKPAPSKSVSKSKSRSTKSTEEDEADEEEDESTATPTPAPVPAPAPSPSEQISDQRKRISNVTRRIAELGMQEEELRERHRQATLETVKERQSITDNRIRVFAALSAALSTNSRARVEARSEWRQVLIDKSPLSLYLLIQAEHLSPDGAYTAESLIARTAEYWQLTQSDKESIQEFKKRFQQSLDGMHSLGGHLPTPEEQATKFIMSLDRKRYGELLSSLHNDSVADRVNRFPTTVDDAAQYACQYQVIPRPTAAPRPAVAYTAEPQEKKKKKPEAKAEEKVRETKSSKTTKARSKKPAAEMSMISENKGRCWHCGKVGHNMFTCELFLKHRDKVLAETAHFSAEDPGDTDEAEGFSYPAMSQPTGLSDHDVVLDSGSSASLFKNENLLTHITVEPRPMLFKGVGGTIRAQSTGQFGRYGRVWIAPDAPVNLLSVSAIRAMHPSASICLEPSGFQVSIDGSSHMFTPRDGLFVRRFHTKSSFAALPFAFADLEKAKAARKFEERMGVPSLEGVKYLASISNQVEPRHVDMANELFGPSPGKLGKVTEPPNRATGSTDILRKEYKHLDLHADLMFIDKRTYLVVVAKPIGLVMSQHLPEGKSSPSLQSSLLNLINECKIHGFQVHSIFIDGERAAGLVAGPLKEAGIRIVASPGTHVPVVENAIKMIKNWTRSILLSLKFRMPEALMHHLVAYVCQRINLVPGKRGLVGVPPIVAFTQRQIQLDKEAKYPFGMYGHATNPNVVNRNSVRVPRTDAVIVLANHDRNGAVYCLSLSTMRVIVRRKIMELPITRDVIERVQSMGDLTSEIGRSLEEDIVSEKIEEAIPGPQLVTEDLNTNTPHAAVLRKKDVPSTVSEPEPETDAELGPEPEPDLQLEQEIEDHAEPPAVHTPVEDDEDDVVRDEDTREEESRNSPPPTTRTSRYGRQTSSIDFKKLDKEGFSCHASIQKAITQHGQAAIDAIESELQQMINKGVFEPTLKPKSRVINSFLFLKEKRDLQGKLIKIKARLVANGSLQNDEKDNSSPTSSTSGLLIVAAVAAQRGMVVTTADISGAYLNAETTAEDRVYMRLDPYLAGCLCRLKPEYGRFLAADKSMTVALLKALYGCKDSGKLWFEELSSFLKVIGFTASKGDPCVFLRGKTILVVYVDDLFIVTTDQEEADELILALEQKYEALTVKRGKNHEYLGMMFDYTVPKMVKISMDSYVSSVIDDWPVSKSAATPARENLFAIDSNSPALSESDKDALHSMVARLLYLAKKVRPDILLPVIFLTTRVQVATQQDKSKLHRILQYLSGTRTLGITFQFDGGPTDTVPCYMDASYGVHMDGKSHSGGVILFGGGPVYVNSRKQKIVTRSSWEAEIVAASDGGTQVLWTVQLLRELGFTAMKALLHQDNKGAIQSMEKGGPSGATTRHINIRYFWIKEQITEGTIKLVWVPTDRMLADGLTKPLQGTKFVEFRNSLHNSKVIEK